MNNDFLRTRKAKFGNFDNFKKSWLYEHYLKLFGPMIYVENSDLNFIAVDSEGYFYDEFYYPYASITKIGTVIPISLYKETLSNVVPDPIWEDVANKGYAVIDKIELDQSLVDQIQNDGYVPFGLNPSLDMSASINQSYYAMQANYDDPESHWNPQHVDNITKEVIKSLPKANSILDNWVMHTADVVKYLHIPSDVNSSSGPYTFHADFFPRALCMIFLYLAKDSNIVGRELLVGKRDDFDSGESMYTKLPDERVKYDRIEIGHQRLILLNTINPMFMHKVEKLRAPNEITFVCSYLWSPKF